MNLKTTSTYVIIGLFGLPTLLLLYLFFRSTFSVWLPDIVANIVALLPAAGAAYLMAAGLARSKMNTVHKVLTAVVTLAAIATLVLELLTLGVSLSRALYMIGN